MLGLAKEVVAFWGLGPVTSLGIFDGDFPMASAFLFRQVSTRCTRWMCDTLPGTNPTYFKDFDALFLHRDVEGLDDIRFETPYSDGQTN